MAMLTQEEKETLEAYNKIGEDWAGTLKPDYWAEEYKKFQEFLQNGKILDLGSGDGRDSLFFTNHGYDYVGVDISPAMIKLAKSKNPKAAFLLKSFYEMDFAPQSFNGFWAACSFLHIPKVKLLDVLKRVKTFLQHQAIGFISVIEGLEEKMEEWEESGQKRFFAYYSQEEFAEILHNSGFEILRKYKVQRQVTGRVFLVFFVKSI